MKVEGAAVFKPIKLSFVLETRDELQFFLDMFDPNLDLDDVEFPESITCSDIYEDLKEKVGM